MKDKFGADVLIVMLLVGIFIIVLVSAAKSNEESTTSDYIEYMTKYKNLDNQINYKNINDNDMAQKYLADFVHLVINDRKASYEIIDDYYKKQVVNTYNKYEKKLQNIVTPLFISAKISSFYVNSIEGNKLYYVKDAANNVFVFKEKEIMNYTVYLDTDVMDL